MSQKRNHKGIQESVVLAKRYTNGKRESLETDPQHVWSVDFQYTWQSNSIGKGNFPPNCSGTRVSIKEKNPKP